MSLTVNGKSNFFELLHSSLQIHPVPNLRVKGSHRSSTLYKQIEEEI